MEMHAYDDVYLESSQNIMGHMFDYAVNELGMNLDDFADRFVISGIAKEMERGNPSFSAGTALGVIGAPYSISSTSPYTSPSTL